MSRSIFSLFAVLCLLVAAVAIAQQQITSVTFDEIPEGTELVGGGAPITLQGDVDATGEISTGVGIRFPDGTLQFTAGAGSSTSSGLYSNRIPDVTPPNAYTEICFKAGATMFDIHAAGEPTSGGNCLPGDTGWVIERFERIAGATETWAQARAACLRDGMRLPEPFEYRFTCDDANPFAVVDLADDWEWALNSSFVVPDADSGIGSALFGNGACTRGSWGWISNASSVTSTHVFRCAL